MARTTNRATIRANIRRKADKPSSVRPTDADLNAMIDTSWSHLWDVITEAEPERYVRAADISVVSGTRSYDLPSTFYKNMGVAVVDTDKLDGYTVLDKYEFSERYDDRYSSDKTFTRYNIQYGKIWFHPTPGWTDTVRLEFIPYAEEWDDNSTIDTINGWTEWVELDVCADLKSLDEEDPSYFLLKRQQVENSILRNSDMDIGSAPTVVDYRRRGKYTWRY